MIKFEEDSFQKFTYTKEQIKKFFENAHKDLKMAENLNNSEIAYRICYEAIIKLGIAMIAKHNYKVRSNTGHHYKILQKIAEITKLKDEINYIQFVRRKRNIDLYEGGSDFTETELKNLLKVTKKIFNHAD